ncbi:hypothetical protein Dsin_008695 [Dipteronia sinensis]|uniref:Phosphoadenosine phosphosulphate reductase domain-containing protein n=1 Tax=Dipteronia sinensis TaxID=43782 RepID=A0AAE0AQ27_9ROSI|nr:hypothetical protein Dsin_008695 [Dipteronia sinensis]
MRLEYKFPDVVEVQALITGQRKYQYPGNRSGNSEVQVDPIFKSLDGGVGSLVKWNPVANVQGGDIRNFLRAMNVHVNSLHLKGYISIVWQHEREGRWWWEDAKARGAHGSVKPWAPNRNRFRKTETGTVTVTAGYGTGWKPVPNRFGYGYGRLKTDQNRRFNRRFGRFLPKTDG